MTSIDKKIKTLDKPKEATIAEKREKENIRVKIVDIGYHHQGKRESWCTYDAPSSSS
jgi:hypothetical protein